MAPPFYAYIKPVVTPNPETYLMVFSDQATADDWWRAVCTSSMDVLKTKSIKRISPQFYAYDPQQIKINTNRLAGGELRLFADKVFFVALPQDHPSSILPQLGTIPLLDITEHISGNWFYIRSKGRNPVYWYCDTNKAGTDTGALVVASRIHSTRFCITAAEVADVPIGAVMVGKDSVELTYSGGQIQISGTGSLYSADTGEQWKLSKFTNGFRLNSHGKRFKPELPPNAIVRTDERDRDGQEWELTSEGILDCGSGEGQSWTPGDGKTYDFK